MVPKSNTNEQTSVDGGDRGVAGVTSVSGTPITSNNSRRGQPLLNRKNLPASFISGCEGQHLCSMILAQAKREGYHLTIGFGKRIEWLRQGENSFFAPGGVLQDYKMARFGSIRKKLANAERHALSIYNAK